MSAFLLRKGIEDKENWHGKPIPKDKLDEILKDLQSHIQVPNRQVSPELPNDDTAPADLSPILLPTPPEYKKGDKVPSEFLILGFRTNGYKESQE